MWARVFLCILTTMLGSGCEGNVVLTSGTATGGASFTDFSGASGVVIGGASLVGGTSATGGALPTGGASATGTTCDDLRGAASTAFWNFVEPNQACTTDSDCVLSQSTLSALCAAPCGYVINSAAVSAAEALAVQLYATFVSRGCPPPIFPCLAPDPIACEAGSCVGSGVP